MPCTPYKVTQTRPFLNTILLASCKYIGVEAGLAGLVLAGQLFWRFNVLKLRTRFALAHYIQPDHFKSPSYAPEIVCGEYKQPLYLGNIQQCCSSLTSEVVSGADPEKYVYGGVAKPAHKVCSKISG